MNPKSPHTITQADVARALGLTQASVSLALRNDPRIPEARRLHIQNAATALGYRPNPTATALAHAKWNTVEKPVSATLAWLNLWAEPAALRRLGEFDRYWQGARAAAENAGYRLEEFVANKSMPLTRLHQVLLARGINGILIPPHPVHPDWGNFDWTRFSIVRFGRSIEHPAAHVVTADHVANMMLAFAETLRLGYTRIGFVAEPARKKWYLFEAGFLMAQQKIASRQRLPIFRMTEGDPAGSQKKLARWLEKEKPDAVLTTISETRAMLEKTGWRIPEDVGVAAMSVLDGNADAGIYQNPEEIGRAAVETMIGLIHGHHLGIPAHPRDILVHGHWIHGSSLPPLTPAFPKRASKKPDRG